MALQLNEAAPDFEAESTAELGGAHRRGVLRMREQHRPRVADRLVEPDASLARELFGTWDEPRPYIRIVPQPS